MKTKDHSKETDTVKKVYFLIMSFLTIFFLSGVVYLINSIHMKSNEEAMDKLRDVSDQSAHAISSLLQDKVDFLNGVWVDLQNHTDDEYDKYMKYLHRMRYIYSFQCVGYADASGKVLTTDNFRTNISDEEIFRKCMDGAICITKQDASGHRFVGRDSNLICIPVYKDSDKPVGVLYQIFSPEVFTSFLETGAFRGKAHACLMESSGDIVALTHSLDLSINENFIQGLGVLDEGNLPFSTKLEADLRFGRSGTGEYTAVAGDRVCCYTPITIEGSKDRWAFMSILPKNVFNAYSKNMAKITIRLSMLIMVYVAFMSFFVYRLRQGQIMDLEKLAFTDPLTGGDNYVAFRQKFETLPKKSGWLITVDLVGFSLINKYYGSAKGNEVICEISRLLSASSQSEHISAHVSDDLFIVYHGKIEIHDIPAYVLELNNTIRGTLKYLDIRGCRPVFGLCAVDEDTDLEQCRSRANFAKKEAKNSGNIYRIYDQKTANDMTENLFLLDGFDAALTDGSLEVWYQPKVSLKTHEVGGAEALVRWRDKDGSLISPGRFIPLLEENGQIYRLDQYVFTKVCTQQKQWLDEGIPIVPVSINLSRGSLEHLNVARRYKQILEQCGASQEYIRLEITEDSITGNITEIIEALRQEGFRVLMDDFGKGSSNLASMRREWFDEIKFDRSLINLIGDPDKEPVLRHSLQMAQTMGMGVTAEGVEKKEQVAFLEEMGCDEIQGFYYYRPMEMSDYKTVLEK